MFFRLGIEGLGFRVWDFGFWGEGVEFEVWGQGFGLDRVTVRLPGALQGVYKGLRLRAQTLYRGCVGCLGVTLTRFVTYQASVYEGGGRPRGFGVWLFEVVQRWSSIFSQLGIGFRASVELHYRAMQELPC